MGRNGVESGPLTLALVGDVMLGRGVNEAVAARGFAYPWGDLLPTLRSADLFLVNLECALTAESTPWQDGTYKAFHFRAEPSVAQTLRMGRVDFACLSNNHAGDFGMAGMLETVRVLDDAGIAHAGAGCNLATARAPALLKARGWRVAIVAFADYPEAWAATPDSPGINYARILTSDPELAPIAEALSAARREADLVIFTIHWGPNMRSRPPDDFRAFARAVVDVGSDLFWGHSAHVVQGIEVWHGKPILYDTGDFVDDYAVDPDLRNDLSALFVVYARPPAVERIELLPVQIGRCQVNAAQGPERQWLVRRMRELCAELGTTLVDSERQPAIHLAVESPVGGPPGQP